ALLTFPTLPAPPECYTFPYTTLFRSRRARQPRRPADRGAQGPCRRLARQPAPGRPQRRARPARAWTEALSPAAVECAIQAWVPRRIGGSGRGRRSSTAARNGSGSQPEARATARIPAPSGEEVSGGMLEPFDDEVDTRLVTGGNRFRSGAVDRDGQRRGRDRRRSATGRACTAFDVRRRREGHPIR